MLLGFHYMEYYHNAYAMNQYLASRGYTVLSVNYRLGIMYGRPFREPPNSVWRGASEYQDVVAGAKFLQTLDNVDPQRIGLWGGSYGGFLTAMGLARNSDIFKAGVDFHGVHDWATFLPMWFAEVDAKNAEVAPDVKEARELAFKSSPVASVATWRSPVLFIHGDDDRNVPFEETTDLIQRAASAGRAARGDRLSRRDPRSAAVAELDRRLPRHRGVLRARAVARAAILSRSAIGHNHK